MHDPSPISVTVLNLNLYLIPFPQVLEHRDHAVQSPQVQSRAEITKIDNFYKCVSWKRAFYETYIIRTEKLTGKPGFNILFHVRLTIVRLSIIKF